MQFIKVQQSGAIRVNVRKTSRTVSACKCATHPELWAACVLRRRPESCVPHVGDSTLGLSKNLIEALAKACQLLELLSSKAAQQTSPCPWHKAYRRALRSEKVVLHTSKQGYLAALLVLEDPLPAGYP